MLTTERPIPPTATAGRRRSLVPTGRAATLRSARAAWLLAGVGLTTIAIVPVARGTAPWWMLVGFAVLPDLSFVAAIGATDDIGRELPRRAVPVYNAVHTLVAPAAVLVAVAVGVLPGAGLVAGLAWAAHIAFDRATGYGLRDRDGHQRG